MQEYLRACEETARAAGAILLEWNGQLNVRDKGPSDVVSEADFASQELIRTRLLANFPDHSFLGEEEDGHPIASADYRWIVDPLDGTMNYVHGVPNYCVSIALERNGEILVGTVFDPVSGECYTAQRGGGAFLNGRRLRTSAVDDVANALVAASFPPQVKRDSPELADFIEVLLSAQSIRRTGSAALNLCYVAAGRFDAFWATETRAWDIAAGMLMVREAGGLMTELDGGPIDLDRPRFLAASTPKLHRQMQQILNRSTR